MSAFDYPNWIKCSNLNGFSNDENFLFISPVNLNFVSDFWGQIALMLSVESYLVFQPSTEQISSLILEAVTQLSFDKCLPHLVAYKAA